MQAPVWLFDSRCVLCSRGVQYTLRHEKAPHIRFIAITSDAGRALAAQYDVDPDDPSTFLFIENGTAFEKSDAVMALAAHLNGPARLARLGRWLPKRLRDAAYGVIARHRYRLFGRMNSCIVPDPDQEARFVL